MKLYYLAYARLPSSKAHGLALMKMCESFSRAGIATTLFVMHRRDAPEPDPFLAYGVPRIFTIHYVPVPDLTNIFPWKLAFGLQSALFYFETFFTILFAKSPDTFLYTRNAPFALLTFFGFNVAYECHAIPARPKSFFWLCRHMDRIVVISESLRALFIAQGFASNKLLLAPSGVDLNIFMTDTSRQEAREKLNLPLDAPIVVYTGSFTTMGEDKGMQDSIQALASVPGALFVAVGGRTEDRERYGTEATQAQVADRVRLLPPVSQETLALYQRAADVLLMPFPDTQHYRFHMSPLKMFEYMASGTPLIASDLPTIRSVLNEETAVIVPPNDPKTLAQAIQRLLNDTEHGIRIAQRAQKEVVQYSWDHRSQQVLQHLAPLMNN
jgi:glycosyltransferase involved in cell wall biosynthesis